MTIVQKVFVKPQTLDVAITLQIEADILNADDAFQLPTGKSGSRD